MSAFTKKLSKEFRRVAAVALLAVAPLALTSCDQNEHKAPAHKTHHHTAVAHKEQAPKIDFNKGAAQQQPVQPQQPGPPTSTASVTAICLYGCPTGAPANDIVVDHKIFILSYNPDTKFADWVGYMVTRQTIGTTQRRTWHRDKMLPKGTPVLYDADYEGVREELSMERGHLAPLASLTGTPQWREADDEDNVTPQKRDLNEGVVEYLERAERNLAQDDNLEVHSLTGTLYERDMPQLPHARLPHQIPSGYWKVITVVESNRFEVAAFIMDQDAPRTENFCDDLKTIPEVEKRSHKTFFPDMDPAQKKQLDQTSGRVLKLLGCGK